MGYGAPVKRVFLDGIYVFYLFFKHIRKSYHLLCNTLDNVTFTGVAHSDDLIYLFPYKDHIPNEHERKVIEHMTGLWAAFVINEK